MTDVPPAPRRRNQPGKNSNHAAATAKPPKTTNPLTPPWFWLSQRAVATSRTSGASGRPARYSAKAPKSTDTRQARTATVVGRAAGPDANSALAASFDHGSPEARMALAATPEIASRAT